VACHQRLSHWFEVLLLCVFSALDQSQDDFHERKCIRSLRDLIEVQGLGVKLENWQDRLQY
jgi:hypothetical protein